MKKSLYASFMILCFGLVESDKKYNALIFDPATRSLIEVSDEFPDKAKCGDWATACPAVDKPDKVFNEEKSYYKNALFVRTIYSPKVNRKDLGLKVCDQPFKLTVVIFEEGREWHYEFGYDIYFTTSLFRPENFQISDRRQYRSIYDILKKSNFVKRFAKIPFEGIGYGYKTWKKEEIPIKQEKDKGFTWIPLFKVKFWPRELRRIEYYISKYNKKPMIDCQDYSLGKEMFNNINADEFYSKEVQEKTFKKLKVPKDAPFLCRTSRECLEKWQLIPADQFQFGSTTPPSCSIMTTIPVWKNIKEILIKVDEYLYTLSRVSRTPLRIIAGVYKHLKLKGSWGLKEAVTLKVKGFPLYVPRIIYKIVAFKVTNGCGKKEGCWYGVMIVIHNDPDYNGESRICIFDKTEEWGWEYITKYTTSSSKGAEKKLKSKYIYVCPVNNVTMDLVGLGGDYKELLLTKELTLKNFPYVTSESPFKLYNVKKNMDREVDPSSEAKSKKLAKPSVIERPLIDRNDFKQG